MSRRHEDRRVGLHGKRQSGRAALHAAGADRARRFVGSCPYVEDEHEPAASWLGSRRVSALVKPNFRPLAQTGRAFGRCRGNFELIQGKPVARRGRKARGLAPTARWLSRRFAHKGHGWARA